MRYFKLFFLHAFVFCVFSGSASALTISVIDGQWSGTSGGLNVDYFNDVPSSYGNGLEDQIRWGYFPHRSGQSGLGFTGRAPASFDVISGEVFELGQLRHFNNPIWSGSEAKEAYLSVAVDFNSSSVGNFNFIFDIYETPNYLGGSAANDVITFPGVYSSDVFNVGGQNYTLQLQGFGDETGYIPSFSSPEGGENSTNLYASVSVAPVPEPATMLLFGTGLAGLAGVTFRRKK